MKICSTHEQPAASVFLIMVSSFFILIGLAACAPSKDDWYDYSKDLKGKRETFMNSQMEGGMSDEEAARAWNAEHAQWQTIDGGRQGSITVEGNVFGD